MSLGDYGMSVVRTVVPTAVGATVAYLVSKGVDIDVLPDVDEEQTLTTGAVIVSGWAWYALARWIEPRVPSWVTTVMGLVGKPPTYPEP